MNTHDLLAMLTSLAVIVGLPMIWKGWLERPDLAEA